MRVFLSLSRILLAAGHIAGFALFGPSPQPAAAAVVYCKAVGIPKGCVARRPVRPAVHCTAPGVPVGCTGGVRGPMNRGGPVNRVGRR